MNRLSLCQRAMVECGASGSMTTTIGQTGELLRFVQWVDQAWEELQTEHDDWGWMRSSQILGGGQGMSFATVAGTATYPLGSGAGTTGVLLANFTKWDRDTFRSYTTSVGTNDEMVLDEVAYDTWRDGYMIGALRTQQTRPFIFAIAPNETVCLGPPPNSLYTITGDYFIAPTTMVADIDTPTGLPAQHHLAIVYKMMMAYSGYEAASEVYQRGDAGYRDHKRQLEFIKLPQVRTGGPLA